MLILLLSLAAHAGDGAYLPRRPRLDQPRVCAARDFRRQLGPARTSGESAYCFAFSSANLLTQRTGVDVSAMDLATGFYLGDARAFATQVTPFVRDELGPDFLARLARETYREGVDIHGPLPILPHLEGGFEASTLAFANARGLCADQNLPSEGGSDAYAALWAKFTADARDARPKVDREVEGVSPRFRQPVADHVHAAWLRYRAKRCHPHSTPVAILPVDYAVAETSREFADGRASGRITDDDQTRVLAALDFALDHARVAAIGFDLNTVQTHAGYVDDDGDHSVAIVGRRRGESGECHYLVRDSAGYACEDFDPAVRRRCLGREYWLTESELRRSIYSVTYLR